jgi:hypothetical protein
MGSRHNPGAFDCAHLAENDEPVFTLLGRDALAPILIEWWATNRAGLIQRGERPDTPHERHQIAEALKCARECSAWRLKNRQPADLE